MKSWFLNVAILLLATITYAQSGTITGEVIDGEYNAPLMGANVLVKGTSHGVSTDMQGKYSLNVNAPYRHLGVFIPRVCNQDRSLQISKR